MSKQSIASAFTSDLAQEQKLRELLLYIGKHSPFYRKLFSRYNVDPFAINTLSDLASLPTTSKEDLQQHNDDFLCVDPRKVIEYTSTSGTSGNPVTIALTENDLQRLAINEYNSLLCADGTPADTYQLMLTLDRQFMAGIAYYSGLRKLGAGIIRLGPGAPLIQWETIHRLKPTSVIALPSFLVKLIEYATDNDINLNSSSIKKAVCIGENIRNTDLSYNVLGKKITDAWNIQLFSTYASTEMQTAFTECREGQGGHLQPDLLILELLDENNKPVASSMPGEVTITTLGVEGMPLLRYKTGDICISFEEPCACGRNSLRLSPVIGRKNQMIKLKGTTFYPPALFDLLNGMTDVRDYIIEVYSNEIGLDEVLLHLLPAEESDSCDERIKTRLQSGLRVNPNIAYITVEEMQKMQLRENSRKTTKFIDRRHRTF